MAAKKAKKATAPKRARVATVEAPVPTPAPEVVDRFEKETKEYRKTVASLEKRDGRIVPFDFGKIVSAIEKSMAASGEGSSKEAEMIAHRVAGDLVRIAKKYKNFMPSVEGIQDSVEKELMLGDYIQTAKGYILYRDKRAKMRESELIQIPEHVKKLAQESSKYFEGNTMGEFVYLRTYAKWIESEGRRETWIETVDRYMAFMKENLEDKLTAKEYGEVRAAILAQKVMPSMRLMQFAGPAARRCNVCAYNCSFIAPSTLRDFGEVLYLSASGTGVGFRAADANVQLLPIIKRQTGKRNKTHVVEDSKEGWANALTLGLETWYRGEDLNFDFSLVRPAGARLKVMGGKASGPEPLKSLLSFARELVLRRQGKRLTNLDVHDLCCKIGEAIVAGGVRRSAMISLSDLGDTEMRHAKSGPFWNTDPQRMMANNSAIYEEKPEATEFLDEWIALMKSQSGERGIFNQSTLPLQLPKRRYDYLKAKYGAEDEENPVIPLGTNPCGEIILQSKQFCNLTEAICRSEDTLVSLKEKIRIATILGTYQSSLSKFGYLSEEWNENCEAERLLGVSLTGQWDSEAVRDPEALAILRNEAIRVNRIYAKKFGINPSSSITCVKPSGTVSQAFNCASGMHPRHAPYYIRRIRISSTDSLFKLLRDQGVPYFPEVGQDAENPYTYVLEFPIKAPRGAIVKDDLSAIKQLEHWKVVKMNYTEHNPSVTVSVGDDEWIQVADWVYKNWDYIGGLSFLPRSNHVYQLAPYEEISKEEYEKRTDAIKHLDFSKLMSYELQDETEVKKELACAGGTCEI